MNTTRKLLAMVLALIMVMSLATSVFAAGTNTITVTETVAKETYKIYKLFDLTVNEALTAYAYTVNEEWSDFFTTGAGKDLITINEQGYVSIADEAAAAALAKAAAAALDGKNVLNSIEATGTTVTFTGLENGYYLITSTLGTLAMTDTTPTNPNAEVQEKNPQDTIEKEVKEDSTGAYGENNDAQVGDTVEFKSKATLNPHTTNVKIHDTMDSGLTYNGDVKIYTSYNEETKVFSNELSADYYTVDNNPSNGETFMITFNQAYLDSLNSATTLYLNYTAVLNENAVVKNDAAVAIVDQYNKTAITYGDKQSVEDQTKTTTHKVIVNKYADQVENLAGAVFSLKKGGQVVNLIKLDDLNYRVAKKNETGAVDTFTTVDSGDIVIWGLDTDTDYTLEEITAPAGYNKLDKEVNVTVNANNSSKIDVENKTGTELPSTGGMGTTLFYVLGGVLVAAAVVLLVTKKRMAN